MSEPLINKESVSFKAVSSRMYIQECLHFMWVGFCVRVCVHARKFFVGFVLISEIQRLSILKQLAQICFQVRFVLGFS